MVFCRQTDGRRRDIAIDTALFFAELLVRFRALSYAVVPEARGRYDLRVNPFVACDLEPDP